MTRPKQAPGVEGPLSATRISTTCIKTINSDIGKKVRSPLNKSLPRKMFNARLSALKVDDSSSCTSTTRGRRRFKKKQPRASIFVMTQQICCSAKRLQEISKAKQIPSIANIESNGTGLSGCNQDETEQQHYEDDGSVSSLSVSLSSGDDADYDDDDDDDTKGDSSCDFSESSDEDGEKWCR